LQAGVKYTYSQERGFIITLKNGKEIKTFNILIEKGVLYYRFSSYGKRKAGIATSAVSQILERKKSGEIETINIPPPSKTVAKGKLAEERYIDKSDKIKKPPINNKKKH
jgi:hypothetical protein